MRQRKPNLKVKKEFCHFKDKCRENKIQWQGNQREREPVFGVQERNMTANVWDQLGGPEMLPSS